MVPHVPLAATTPVELLEALSSDVGAEIWVKRDDLSADPYGGNKVRKLEYLLAEARHEGAQTLVTAGAYGSHHVLATSIYGRRWGFEVEAIMTPQPMTPHVEQNLRCDVAVGAKLHRVPTWAAVVPAMTARATALRLEGRKPYAVPYGGSSATGALGFVEAGLELGKQIDSGEMPEPDAIVIPLGSGGTASGLALGLRGAGLVTPVIAVRVTPLLVCNRATIAALVMGCLRKIRAIEPAYPVVGRQAVGQIDIDGSQYGSGYGSEDDAVEQAVAIGAEHGLKLDATYTGRAFAAALALARGPRAGQRILFWNTLNSADLASLAAEASLPPWAA